MINKLKDIPSKIYITIIVLLIIFRIATAGALPIWAMPNAAYDDGLMANMAYSILKGEWLGEYSQFTLMKGITFPIFLVITHLLNVPYMTANILLFALACFVMCQALCKILPQNWKRCILFSVLFFNPINASVDTLSKVYRDSIAPALSLLCFATIIGCYLYREEQTLRFWLTGAGISLFAFVNLREDSIWIIPFVFFALFITALYIKGNKKFLFLIPLLIMFVGNQLICLQNYNVYGIYARTDLTSGAFADMLKTIYKIKPEEDIYRVSVPKSTVDKLYEVSPTFYNLKDVIEPHYQMQGWDEVDGEKDGQIRDGWFFWCIRGALQDKGYFETPQTMQAFCSSVTAELEAAFENGTLEKRNGMVMPAALMSPWKSSYAEDIVPEFIKTYIFASDMNATSMSLRPSSDNMADIERIETLTHNSAIKDENIIDIAGWLVSKDDNVEITASIWSNGQKISELDKKESNDIFLFFKNADLTLENARNARFNENILTSGITDDIVIKVYLDGVIVEETKLTEEYKGTVTEQYQTCIDVYSVKEVTQSLSKVSEPKVAIVERFNSIYRVLAAPLNIFALLCYIGLCVYFFLNFRKEKWYEKKIVSYWLICTGILASICINIGGVAYTTLSAFPAMNTWYLSSAICMLWVFTVLSITLLAIHVKETLLLKINR